MLQAQEKLLLKVFTTNGCCVQNHTLHMGPDTEDIPTLVRQRTYGGLPRFCNWVDCLSAIADVATD
jgi:hypothetical protein